MSGSVQPYLIFNGDCEEAVKLYCSVFDGKVEFTQKYKETPNDVPDHWKDKVIHTTFTIRGDKIMASDSQPNITVTTGNNIHLSVNFEKNEKMDDMFNKLANGGRILMPLQKTFWGANFGMLIDKFGVNWMFNQHL